MKPYLRRSDAREAALAVLGMLAAVFFLAFIAERLPSAEKVVQASAETAGDVKRAVKGAGRAAGSAWQGISDWWERE